MRRVTFCLISCLCFAVTGPVVGQKASSRVPSDARSVSAGINRFSIDLYKSVSGRAGNVFVSPASVSIAVALAYRGAVGPTAEELGRTMRYGAPPAAYLRANAAMLSDLAVAPEAGQLRLANALWLQAGMPLRPDFAADMALYAKAGLYRVDYRSDAQAARGTINAWVATATAGKIGQLLLHDDVSNTSRAILVNTIYWKGRWASAFSPALTKPETFTRIDGTTTPTPLMHQRSEFRVARRGTVSAIDLPYGNGEVSMTVLLPDSPRGVPRLERDLTDEGLARWFADLDAAVPRETLLALPRLHLEWRDDLVPTLKALGAETAFGDDADFSGMATFPYPGEVPEAIGLKIKRVIHQTFLDVDEQGSEAAAATAVVMDVIVTGVRRKLQPPFVFRADKPFVFLLRHKRTGTILFMGRYVTPG